MKSASSACEDRPTSAQTRPTSHKSAQRYFRLSRLRSSKHAQTSSSNQDNSCTNLSKGCCFAFAAGGLFWTTSGWFVRRYFKSTVISRRPISAPPKRRHHVLFPLRSVGLARPFLPRVAGEDPDGHFPSKTDGCGPFPSRIRGGGA